MSKSVKNITIIKEPYLYAGEFKTLNGDTINYCHLCVDVQIGDTVVKLKRTVKGLEREYIAKMLEEDGVNPDYVEGEL